MLTVKNLDQRSIDALQGNAFSASTMDAATSGGMAFLQAELEKRDPKVREPLTSVTWMRDIVAKTGGGWVDFTSTMHVDYSTAGPNLYGIIGGQTNTIPTMQADIGKDVFAVYNWGNVMTVPYIDMNKLQGLGRSLDDLLDKGIKLNWNKALDKMVYNGYGADYGLVNQTAITTTNVTAGVQGRTWATKTPDEILYDVNLAMVTTWAASEYDVTGMCNHILIPPSQYAFICSQKVSLAGNMSILTYLLENNIGKTQGVDLQIYPSRWCINAYSTSYDIMCCYVNDEDRLYFDITVPIQRAMTMPSVQEAAYLTLYLGQMGIPKFLYTQPAIYYYGI